ncbi:TetR/AcrR family transcriptional regulator [Amycolatopsis cynarae]|uniref:TetR/AcrR family transcriptional regulator n=1 Tax=Amycolatopsis cynarae TaxID=2995223 RepID=A0ABY7BA66_9PSEU|nr:TetR/AcrR family transcriptional regulator [Amycolatopsis sp. HUAS 11-8]WAL69259.1 TetR/AcrR family transcriptional regulator [Amycolatopsis sp. HUAS 11-8]
MKISGAARMSGQQRREQLLELAAEEFARAGLHGTSTETLARRAGITQTYVFRLFGSKKALFLQVVRQAFGRLVEGMDQAAEQDTENPLAAMGLFYDRALADRTGLLVQLQAFAACGDPEVRTVVREQMARMWAVTAERSALPPVAVKTFLAYGMLLNTAAALEVDEVDAEWARGIRTRIQAGLFDHLTEENNR